MDRIRFTSLECVFPESKKYMMLLQTSGTDRSGKGLPPSFCFPTTRAPKASLVLWGRRLAGEISQDHGLPPLQSPCLLSQSASVAVWTSSGMSHDCSGPVSSCSRLLSTLRNVLLCLAFSGLVCGFCGTSVCISSL